MSDRKAAQLGMPLGTACARLRKAILFSLLQRLGDDSCFKCSLKIESVDDLSIEHKQSWLNRDVRLFWDLDNIAFSHLRCNTKDNPSRNGKRPGLMLKNTVEGKTWCPGHSDYVVNDMFTKNTSSSTGLEAVCRDCRSARRKYAPAIP